MRIIEFDRINAAVRSCLARCYAANEVLPTVAAFVTDLRKDGWNERDAHRVERIVLRLLRRIIEPAIGTGDATDCPASQAGSDGQRASRTAGA